MNAFTRQDMQQDTEGFPFQKPFQPQGGGANGPGPGTGPGPLRPFTAVDIAPPAKPGTPVPLGSPVSPFLEAYPGPTDGAHAGQPAPAPQQSAPEWTEVAMPMPSPPPPAAARQSRIMAAADLLGSGDPAPKPSFFLTTTALVDGCAIQSYLDVISTEIVLPKDLLFRNPAPYGEMHRLKAAEDQLQKVKAMAMEELSDRARALHADGIVGVTVTFTNLDTVCCLCSAVGTAVRIA